MDSFKEKNITFIDICREFIKEIDKSYPVSFGYLFGSRAKGSSNAMSDIDIALKFVKDYDDEEDVYNRGDIIETGKRYFKDSVDVVNLDKAPLILKYEVVREGIVLMDEDSGKRADFESLTLREYFDFQYYSEYYNNAAIKRIKEGNYFRG
jgi:predicted nucleotidyltransferase